MSYVQPDLIAWWYKGLYYRDLQMAQCVQLGFLTQTEHDEIKAANGWWGAYRYVAQSPQRDRPDSVAPLPVIVTAEAESTQTQDAESTATADEEPAGAGGESAEVVDADV